MESIFWLALSAIAAVMVAFTFLVAMSRYKRCPSNQILVKYGKVGGGRSALPIHGGATFVWPLLQDFAFLELAPITTDIDLKNALSKQNIRVNVPSRFTFGIGTTAELMNAAAERLLRMPRSQIEETAKDIIFGQLRATIATMDIEEINADREGFEKKVMDNIETELKKIGLYLINVNISDISDESGYLKALGQKAAAEAVNKAKVAVAEQERDGASGQAAAKQMERVSVANANAAAVTGENEAKVKEAQSLATRRVAEAEAQRAGDAATAVKSAEALKEGYQAQKIAEDTRAERDRSTQFANIVVPAEIQKKKVVTEAEAAKEQAVLKGKGDGEALQAILEGRANGLEAIVKAAGGDPKMAATLMIVENLPEIVKSQVEAIRNIKFDKIVVYDGGGDGGSGNRAADWLGGIVRMLPGLQDFADMAGVQLPELLGKRLPDAIGNDSPTAEVAGGEADPASDAGEPTQPTA